MGDVMLRCRSVILQWEGAVREQAVVVLKDT